MIMIMTILIVLAIMMIMIIGGQTGSEVGGGEKRVPLRTTNSIIVIITTGVCEISTVIAGVFNIAVCFQCAKYHFVWLLSLSIIYSRCRWCFQCPDPAPLVSKLTPRYPTAAHHNECSFHRPVGLTLPMSVKIDIRGEGGSPTLTTSSMSVYFADTGITITITITITIIIIIIIIIVIIVIISSSIGASINISSCPVCFGRFDRIAVWALRCLLFVLSISRLAVLWPRVCRRIVSEVLVGRLYIYIYIYIYTYTYNDKRNAETAKR